MLRPQQARMIMFSRVDTIWKAKAEGIVGYIPEIRWQGFEVPGLPGSDKFWMRASTNGVASPQRGHMMPQVGISQPVYDNLGYITLQIFAPMNSPLAWSKGELLAELGQCMFMAAETSGGIWFRNPRIRTLDNDGSWYRWNVIADYEFSQVKNLDTLQLDQFLADNNIQIAGSGDGLQIIGNDLRVDIDELPSG